MALTYLWASKAISSDYLSTPFCQSVPFQLQLGPAENLSKSLLQCGKSGSSNHLSLRVALANQEASYCWMAIFASKF
jgi:hypothetical protein